MLRLTSVAVGIAFAAMAMAQQATVEQAQSKGMLAYLAFCFTGGLVSLLTPCVFPMVPVTVSYFSKREQGRALPEALAYSFGIVSTFAILGVAASAIFGATGITAFSANPWVNLVLGVVFIVLALNLFGLFEIQVPSFLTRKTNEQRARGGLVGPYFMGITFSLTSFTCTAPIAGSLLAAAAKGGDLVAPTVGMATYGLAFAAPFFFLALSPSSLSKLPKSGEWMNTVKPALAFVELAAAVKFLSNADLGFELALITRPVFLVLWVGIFIGLALYLLGIPKALKTAGTARRAFGVASFAFAVFLAFGITRPSLGVVESFPPPDPYPAKSNKSGSEGQIAAKKEVKGRIEAANYEEALKLAKETGRPVFIDFTGVACVNCRLMEKHIFPKEAVSTELDKMVTVQLYTDRPKAEDQANQKLQQELAKNVALPTYVLLTPEGKVIDKFEGLAQSPEEFAGFLKKGGA